MLILICSRRGYAIAAENARVQQQATAAATVMRKNVAADLRGGIPGSVEKKEFWMRDPKTGNWIPESQFNQIDAADLRDKFLSKKN